MVLICHNSSQVSSLKFANSLVSRCRYDRPVEIYIPNDYVSAIISNCENAEHQMPIGLIGKNFCPSLETAPPDYDPATEMIISLVIVGRYL